MNKQIYDKLCIALENNKNWKDVREAWYGDCNEFYCDEENYFKLRPHYFVFNVGCDINEVVKTILPASGRYVFLFDVFIPENNDSLFVVKIGFRV